MIKESPAIGIDKYNIILCEWLYPSKNIVRYYIDFRPNNNSFIGNYRYLYYISHM